MRRLLALLVALVGAAGVLAASTAPAAGAGVVERAAVTPAMDAFLPGDAAAAAPAVLFVHGGGWSKGTRAWWSGHARRFTARTGWPSFTVDYALDAARPHLVQRADVVAAVDWVRANAADLGVDPDRIALVGASAGGHLALLAGTTGADVQAVVSLAGVADLPALPELSLIHI